MRCRRRVKSASLESTWREPARRWRKETKLPLSSGAISALRLPLRMLPLPKGSSLPDHFRRATLARRLFELGALPEDLGDLMIRLNNERKHGVYEGRSPNLHGRSWEQILGSLEHVVEAAAEVERAN